MDAVDAVGCDPKDRPKKYINRYCVTSWLGDALTTAPFGPFFNNLQLARSRTVLDKVNPSKSIKVVFPALLISLALGLSTKAQAWAKAYH